MQLYKTDLSFFKLHMNIRQKPFLRYTPVVHFKEPSNYEFKHVGLRKLLTKYVKICQHAIL